MTSEKEAILLLLYAFAVGVGLGAFYDLFRVTRIALFGRRKKSENTRIRLPLDHTGVERVLKPKQEQGFCDISFWGIFFSDVIFSVISAITVTVLLFQFGSGNVRAFSLFGAFFGFAVYYFTLGRLVIIFADAIISGVKIAVKTVFHYTLHPILKLFGYLTGKIAKPLKRYLRKKKANKLEKQKQKRRKTRVSSTCENKPNGRDIENERIKRKRNNKSGKGAVSVRKRKASKGH